MRYDKCFLPLQYMYIPGINIFFCRIVGKVPDIWIRQIMTLGAWNKKYMIKNQTCYLTFRKKVFSCHALPSEPLCVDVRVWELLVESAESHSAQFF